LSLISYPLIRHTRLPSLLGPRRPPADGSAFESR